MSEPLLFDDKELFLQKLRELKARGYGAGDLRIHMPWAVPEVEEILEVSSGGMRLFAVIGGVGGFLSGLALTLYTAWSLPMIVGGKPVFSMPPFLLIAYILTILFGGLLTFLGFLILAQLPSVSRLMETEDYGNRFAIILKDGG